MRRLTGHGRVLAAADPPMQAALAAGIRAFDAGIDFVDDCEHALLRVLQDAFDLVLLDVDLPGMPATEVCRLIGQQDAALPVAAIGAPPSCIHGAAPAGFATVLPKPFDNRRVAHLLRVHLRPRQVAHEVGDATLDAALESLRATFVAGLEQRYLSDMRGHFRSGELDCLRRAAHALAGSAGCHRLTRLSVAASCLEQALCGSPAPDAAQLAIRFDDLLDSAAALSQTTEDDR